MAASSSLPLLVVQVLDRLPDPPGVFTLRGVATALADVRTLGVDGATEATPEGVLGELLRAEVVSGAAGRYVVHPDARPL